MARDLAALLLYIEERQAVPFGWEQPNDCVSFALNGVRVQAGWSPHKGLQWSSHRGAMRVIRRLGGLEAALDARMTAITPAMAMRGDVAGIADDQIGVRLAIVEGEMLVCPSERGLRRHPRALMIRAWSADQPNG